MSVNEVLRSAWVAPALHAGLVTQTGHHRTTAETGGAHSLELPSHGEGAMGHSLGFQMPPLQSSFPHLPSALMSSRASWWQSSGVSTRAVVFLSPTEMSHCLSCCLSPVSAWC